jgi:hypothetical protein
MLADGVGSPLDQGVATWLMVGAVFLGWIGIARLRGRAFLRLPKAAGWVLTGLAATSLILALVLPPIIRPNPPATRPSTDATVEITSPRPDEVFQGNPARVPVAIRLHGGTIVQYTSTKLVPDTGHIHVYLDGDLISMTTALHRTLDVLPGKHTLTVEFVAVDHVPWKPRVRSTVAFEVEGG